MTHTLDHYAVFGDPIAHSLSPQIHRYFANQTQQALDYQAIQCASGQLKKHLKEFIQQGGKGCNITLPLKQEAYDLVTTHSKLAASAKAVNTIEVNIDGSLTGHNTDGLGFLQDLTVNKGFNLNGKRVLLLGAGGAVRGILEPLLASGAAEIFLCNRNLEKAVALQAEFAGPIQVYELNQIPKMACDVIINGTAASVKQQTLPIPRHCITAKTISYDLAYGDSAQAFCDQMRVMGTKNQYDGWGMLVEQAALSFELWRGIKPVTTHLIENKKESIAGLKKE